MTRSSLCAIAGLLFWSAGPAVAQSLTDAQIAAIVVTANQVDVDAGRVAAARSSSSAVKTFANLMVTDHTSVNAQATALATKLHLTPADNATSQALKDGGTKNVAALKALSGKAFDEAYVDHEVAYHQTVLDALEVAGKLADEGISVEVVDLRTIAPYDEATVTASVEKTGRAIVLHEALQDL